MRVVVDTNVLLRAAQPRHSQAKLAQKALQRLTDARDEPCIVPQVVYEYWVVATRPAGENGLGLSTAMADAEIDKLLNAFTLLDDRPDLLTNWRALVTKAAVLGRAAHDARIVAAMASHGVHTILTFNAGDFSRYSATITVVSPGG
jgi:predicted nucleic acid-binding protein